MVVQTLVAEWWWWSSSVGSPWLSSLSTARLCVTTRNIIHRTTSPATASAIAVSCSRLAEVASIRYLTSIIIIPELDVMLAPCENVSRVLDGRRWRRSNSGSSNVYGRYQRWACSVVTQGDVSKQQQSGRDRIQFNQYHACRYTMSLALAALQSLHRRTLSQRTSSSARCDRRSHLWMSEPVVSGGGGEPCLEQNMLFAAFSGPCNISADSYFSSAKMQQITRFAFLAQCSLNARLRLVGLCLNLHSIQFVYVFQSIKNFFSIATDILKVISLRVV